MRPHHTIPGCSTVILTLFACLPTLLSLSCATCYSRVAQAPQADLEQKAKAEQEFTAFDPRYKEEKAERIAKLRTLYATVRDREAANQNTSCSHQILWELKALVTTSADFKLIDQRIADLENGLAHPDQETVANQQDPRDGSWGRCFDEWYCKLDASTDDLNKFSDKHHRLQIQPRFLDRINSAEKLTEYLTSVSVSDIPRTGIDHGQNSIFLSET